MDVHIVDSIVFICFLIIPETNKPENSFLFSFLKPFTIYDHLIGLKLIAKSKIFLKTISIHFHKGVFLILVIFKPESVTKY